MSQVPTPNLPPLRRDLQLISGEAGSMIFDPAADAYYKVSGKSLKIIGFMTGNMTLEAFQEKVAANGVSATKEELLQVILFLRQNNLLAPGYGETALKREKMQSAKERSRFLRFSAAYLFFRLPPWRPEKCFEKISPYVSFLASRWFLLLLLIPALAGYLLVLRDFSAVKTTFLDSLSWAGLVKYFGAILMLKIIHEAAHAVAAMHFKCRVRGIGLGFMVFYPRLYTDTTDSWRLPRSRRFLIDGAGIIIELLLGGIAALLWFELPPGVWKYTMFYIFSVSTLSTLLVNGNPLIRYDGYYILCDLLNIENLMTRSAEYIKQWWRWTFLKIGKAPSGEHGKIFFIFGISSFIYRIFLYTSIILVLYHSFAKVIAILLIILELYSIFIYPLFREIKTVMLLSKQSMKSTTLFLGVCHLLVLAGVLFLPVPWSTVLPGETAPESVTQVTASVGGYLCSDLPGEAKTVKHGETLFELKSPALAFASESLRKKNEYEKLLYSQQQLDDKSFAESFVTAEKIKSNELGLEELERQQRSLRAEAQTEGTFVSKLPDLSAGAFLPKGTLIGEIVSEKKIVYAYADDQQIGDIRVNDRAKLSCGDSLRTFSARVTAIDKVAVQLKSSPVLQTFGGSVPVFFDEKNNTWLSSGTLYRVTLEPIEMPLFSGRKVTVKIAQSKQLYRTLKNLILSGFRKEFAM